MTGAPLPSGADSVQQVEVTRETEDGRLVTVERATQPGQFYAPRASEIASGERVLESGEEINAARAAVLAAFGRARVQVGRRPRVAVWRRGRSWCGSRSGPAKTRYATRTRTRSPHTRGSRAPRWSVFRSRATTRFSCVAR